MECFKKELSDLLRKHDMAVVCHDTKGGAPHNVEIGFQNMKNISEITYTCSNHITWCDLIAKDT